MISLRSHILFKAISACLLAAFALLPFHFYLHAEEHSIEHSGDCFFCRIVKTLFLILLFAAVWLTRRRPQPFCAPSPGNPQTCDVPGGMRTRAPPLFS